MKKLLIILSIFFVTGCSASYEIDFNQNNIVESIDLTIDGDIYQIAANGFGDGEYIEEEVLNNYIPVLKDSNNYYDKTIQVNNGKTNVKLKGSYLYSELENLYIIDHCFSSIYVNNQESYLDVSLHDYICSNNVSDNVVLKIKSEYEIVENNSDYYSNGYYNWNLNTIDKNGIEFRIIKEINNKNSSNTFKKVLSGFLILGFAITGGFLFYARKKQ